MRKITKAERDELVKAIFLELERSDDLPGGNVTVTYEVGDDLRFEIESERDPNGMPTRYMVVGIVNGIDTEAITIHGASKAEEFYRDIDSVVRMCTLDA